MKGRLRRREELTLLLAFVCVSGALAYGLVAPYLLGLTLVVVVSFPFLRRIQASAPPLVEGAIVGASLLVAFPLGMAEASSALGLSLFLLVAMAVKVVAPRTERDRATAAVVGVVLTGVAASEAVEPLFAGIFLACLTCLAGFVAVRAQRFRGVSDEQHDQATFHSPEPAVEPAPWRNRVWVAPASRLRRLTAWSGVLSAIAVGTVLFFMAFPRTGAKLLSNQRETATQRLSGFTDRVGLGDIGRLKQNQAVAFRVEAKGESPFSAGTDPFWRGRALDRYDGSTWNISRVFRWAGRRLNGMGRMGFKDPLYIPPQDVPASTLTFYVEPLGTPVLFTWGGTRSFQFKTARPLRLGRDALGGFYTKPLYSTPMSYEAEAYPEGSGKLLLTRAMRRRIARLCLRVPPQVNRERLRAYGLRVLRERRVSLADGPERVARALSAHLSQTLSYTLVARRTSDLEPIEDFLFVKKEGHCELFASAHAMILRTLDVPARLVTGFRGGEYSTWSKAYTVRQTNAHAWTEVLTPRGWIRCDPTPAEAPREPSMQLFELLAGLLDWLELRWFAYVIAFDSYDQRSILRRLRAWFEESGPADAGAGGARLRLSPWLLFLLLGGACLTSVVLARKLRRAPGGPGEGDLAATPSSQALAELLQALGRRGYVRRPEETPLELVRRAGPPLGMSERLIAWIADYYSERFGQRTLEGEELAAMSTLLTELQRDQLQQPA